MNPHEEDHIVPDDELDGMLAPESLLDVPEPTNESGQDPEAEGDDDDDEAGTS